VSEPIRLEGIKDLEAALKKFDETAYKKLNKAINKAAGRIRINAREYIPNNPMPMLSNWSGPITGQQMRGFNGQGRIFPRYDAAEMRSEIKTRKRKQGKTRNGWGQVVFVEQMSPAGNIYEKGGILPGPNPRGNNSRNPNASIQFKSKMQDFYSIRKGTGRALIRSGREDAGQAKNEISRARYEAELELQRRFNQEAARHG
jgi:hypothetical protein